VATWASFAQGFLRFMAPGTKPRRRIRIRPSFSRASTSTEETGAIGELSRILDAKDPDLSAFGGGVESW